MIDFSIPSSLLAALAIGFLLPIPLWITTKIPALQEKNPVQFLAAAICVFAIWIAVVSLNPQLSPKNSAEWLIGLMALSASTIVYLEVWGLLSRGYTLSVLAALSETGRPLTPSEIARAYRGGDGLDWIMRHRLGGLEASGMITKNQDSVKLKAPAGVMVAQAYRICVFILGLRRTG